MTLPTQREKNGRFLPGFTPNPSGRPAVVKEVRELAREHVPAAIARLAELVNSKNEGTALAAIEQLLNRVYGKPAQWVDATVQKFDMAQLYLAAVRAANEAPPQAVTVDTDALPDAPSNASPVNPTGDSLPRAPLTPQTEAALLNSPPRCGGA